MYNLLIIEDDPIVAKALSHIFAAEKYEVKITGSLGEGLQTALKELPDLILLDVNLPDGNGSSLCRVIKEDPRIKHIPVILMTGDATSVENKVQGLEYGADDYVIKPFIPEELLARVAGVIKRSFSPRD